MKKKYTNIVLVLLIVGIWGYIVLEVFNPFAEDEILAPSIAKTEQKIVGKKKERYTIQLNYNDPFKSKYFKSSQRSNLPKTRKPKAKIATQVKAPPVKITWPTVEYKGRIKNHSTQENVALVKINGRNYRLSANEKVGDILIKSVWKDSISLAMNSNERVFILQ